MTTDAQPIAPNSKAQSASANSRHDSNPLVALAEGSTPSSATVAGAATPPEVATVTNTAVASSTAGSGGGGGGGEATARPRSKHSYSSSNASRRRVPRSSPAEFLSDRATSQLIRRVLCPQSAPDRGKATPPPINEILPPLTSRNDIDLQLYAIISIVLRDFVQTWYNKITPDEVFVAEVVQIIAHCTRALEQRLRQVDIESLVFDELPDLFDKHVQAYRASRTLLVQSPVEVNARETYHSLCPLPHLSPLPDPRNPKTIVKQAENEATYRQLLVQGVLTVLLPTEDLENDCLTALVGQILSELIIGGVIANKASEPWMLWNGFSILADVIGRQRRGVAQPDLEGKTGSRLKPRGFSVSGLLWSLVHYVFALTGFIRLLVSTVARSRHLPSRGQSLAPHKSDAGHHDMESASMDTGRIQLETRSAKTPVLAYAIWPTISNLIRLDYHMPWLLGNISMLQWLAIAGPGRAAGADGIVDRFLSDAIQRKVLDPGTLPTVLRNLRGAIFPNNAMGSPTMFPPETDSELRALKRKCARALWDIIPQNVGKVYYGSQGSAWLATWFGASATNPPAPTLTSFPRSDTMSSSSSSDRSVSESNRVEDKQGLETDNPDAHILSAIETDILDVFSDSYCNKHFVYSALELILLRLVPELAEKGVVELWEERLSF
ncbi:PXA domain-domain-containing protein [Coniella lustricola]|uniref:PXA domain-domain-containing protein n=1 Tax=Coniella lustricola TaxID=2025994 RepID=A0A2T2ZTK0_9PEZI|nr:PXA domain-domain-containing protein [Coniella lustricola]